ncbi:MAG: sigma 54-interacting transcriptional regulator [Polyangiaceae bacterium]|nr:sigma 54-interacting transcriptional regulator [Polyangiaceae bacterium]
MTDPTRPNPGPTPTANHLVALSEPMRQLASQVDRAASAAGAVLILGERGAGRTFVARALHHRSPHGKAPFVALDLSEVSLQHQRDVLFGRASLVDLDGTLCLKEIEHLAPELQVELSQRIGRTGSRIVATSARPLEQWAGAGAFSVQLLGVFSDRLRVPALRERQEDLAELVRTLTREACAAARRNTLTPSEAFILALSRYDFPGNITQLRAVLDRAIQRVGVEEELGTSALSSISEFREPGAFSASLSYRDTRTHFENGFEKAYVSWLLERHQDNISAAAREARMDRKHLYDLARKHGLRRPRGLEDD